MRPGINGCAWIALAMLSMYAAGPASQSHAVAT